MAVICTFKSLASIKLPVMRYGYFHHSCCFQNVIYKEGLILSLGVILLIAMDHDAACKTILIGYGCYCFKMVPRPCKDNGQNELKFFVSFIMNVKQN